MIVIFVAPNRSSIRAVCPTTEQLFFSLFRCVMETGFIHHCTIVFFENITIYIRQKLEKYIEYTVSTTRKWFATNNVCWPVCQASVNVKSLQNIYLRFLFEIALKQTALPDS
jgi:hypothetical protein